MIREDDGEWRSGRDPGFNRKDLLRLRRGEFQIEASLDLHGMWEDKANNAVRAFLSEADADGRRCVLVITGRGAHSSGGLPVLRDLLPEWLSQAPLSGRVLAFCSAQPRDGGAGAYYVVLRRSDGRKGIQAAR